MAAELCMRAWLWLGSGVRRRMELVVVVDGFGKIRLSVMGFGVGVRVMRGNGGCLASGRVV